MGSIEHMREGDRSISWRSSCRGVVLSRCIYELTAYQVEQHWGEEYDRHTEAPAVVHIPAPMHRRRKYIIWLSDACPLGSEERAMTHMTLMTHHAHVIYM